MSKYRVKPGYKHGVGDKYGPGDIVELSPQDAAGFLDKLELVPEYIDVIETPPALSLTPVPPTEPQEKPRGKSPDPDPVRPSTRRKKRV